MTLTIQSLMGGSVTKTKQELKIINNIPHLVTVVETKALSGKQVEFFIAEELPRLFHILNYLRDK